MTETPTPVRKKPREFETVSLAGRTKWRLDALSLAGRRSRTATVALLLDFYMQAHPQIRLWVEERARDPKPIRFRRGTADASSEGTESPSAAVADTDSR